MTRPRCRRRSEVTRNRALGTLLAHRKPSSGTVRPGGSRIVGLVGSGRAYWDFPRRLSAVRLLLEVGGEWGIPASVSLAGTGLSLSDLDRVGQTVEAEQELRVIRNIASATGDPPGLGATVGVRLKLSSLGVWGLLLLSSRTIEDVIRVGPRYYQLSENFLRPSIERRASSVCLVYSDDEIPSDVRGFIVERDLAYNVTSVRSMVGSSTPLHLTARLPAARGAALEGSLPGFVVDSESARNTIELPYWMLRRQLISADDETHRRCLARCDELVETLRRREGVANQVRTALHNSSCPLPTLDEVAEQFHVDARTVRRWLVEEATSYRALSDEVSAHRAIELLDTPGITVQQAARRLGYAGAASFTRAFRRWTGETPTAWSRGRAGQTAGAEHIDER
jgi:AraC-like DNA-binding protein